MKTTYGHRLSSLSRKLFIMNFLHEVKQSMTLVKHLDSSRLIFSNISAIAVCLRLVSSYPRINISSSKNEDIPIGNLRKRFAFFGQNTRSHNDNSKTKTHQ